MECEKITIETRLLDGTFVLIMVDGPPSEVWYPGEEDGEIYNFKPVRFGIPDIGDFYFSKKCTNGATKGVLLKCVQYSHIENYTWIYEDIK